MAWIPWAEVIEAVVFRTISGRPSLWEAMLPAELLRLPNELGRADALLDDPVFYRAVRAALFTRCWAGRPRRSSAVCG